MSFLHRLFLGNKKQTSGKKYSFSIQFKTTCKNSGTFEEKKKNSRSSLTSLLHPLLQLINRQELTSSTSSSTIFTNSYACAKGTHCIWTADHKLVRCDCKLVSLDCWLLKCDHKLASCNRKLVSCDRKLESCNRKLLRCDRKLVRCDRKLVSYDRNLVSFDRNLVRYNRKLVSCDRKLLSCNRDLLFIKLWAATLRMLEMET